MRVNKLILLFTVSIIFLSCKNESNKVGIFPSEEKIIQQMNTIMGDSDLPGLVAIAVNTDGEKREYTYGNAIWEEDSPIRSNNIFRIASMTKLVTSVAALQLFEMDSIDLDEDLSLIMPEMTSIPILTDEKVLVKGKNPITLRHLLTHTSGFGYSFTDSLLENFETKDWIYEDLPRRFESGTKFLYGRSTDWAGKLIEKISGLSLEDFFRIHITGPLKMNRTWFNVPDSLKNEIVSYGIRNTDESQKLSEFSNRIPNSITTNFSGGGGLYSTPEDYTKLLVCILNNGAYDGRQLLQKTTIDEMFKDQIGDISMNIENNYFRIGFCCDFRGLIKSNSKWSLAGLIDTERTSYGRKAGTLLWGGIYNTYFYIDRLSGVAASIYTQYLPFNHPTTTSIFDKFSEIIYSKYND